MKKLIALLLAAIMAFSICACSGSKAEQESETLDLLNSAYDYCHTGMVYMLNAWEFSIQHGSDNSLEEYNALWDEFGKHTGMTEEDMVDALINGCGMTLEDLSKYGDDGKTKDPSRGLNTLVNGMLFMDANYSVQAAKYTFEQRNKVVDINAKLEQIKENLKQIGEKSKAYELLKEYYLMVCEMEKWVKSPDGSFNSSSSNMADYEKKFENFKQELDLIIS